MLIGVALLAMSKYMKIVNMEGMSRKQLYHATLAHLPPPFPKHEKCSRVRASARAPSHSQSLANQRAAPPPPLL